MSKKSKTYSCLLSKKVAAFIDHNPHCASFFCRFDDISLLSKKKPQKYQKPAYVYSKVVPRKDVMHKTNLPPFTDLDTVYQPTLFKTWKDVEKNCKKQKIKKEALLYVPIAQRPVSQIHIGQLKLFLSTLQFLLYYAPKNREVHVVYPGSAPGNNTYFITKLFPQCKWHLIDPTPHAKNLLNSPNVVFVKQDLFTPEIVQDRKEALHNKYVLLISDIRLNNNNESVERDNQLQRSWVEELKPNYAQLKFRLSRMSKNPEYLDGTCYLQMYPRKDSTETRLVVKGKGGIKTKVYSEDYYEGVLYYYNKILRTSHYPNHYTRIEALDHCHDCSSMIQLLKEYQEKYPENPFSKMSLTAFVQTIFSTISTTTHKKTPINNKFSYLNKQLGRQLKK